MAARPPVGLVGCAESAHAAGRQALYSWVGWVLIIHFTQRGIVSEGGWEGLGGEAGCACTTWHCRVLGSISEGSYI